MTEVAGVAPGAPQPKSTTNGKLELVEEWRVVVTWRTGETITHECSTRCEAHGTTRCQAHGIAWHLARSTRVEHVEIERRIASPWHAPPPVTDDEPARPRRPKKQSKPVTLAPTAADDLT